MVRRLPCAWALLLAASGCVSTDSDLTMVTSGPTGTTSFAIPREMFNPKKAPASEAEEQRVLAVGQKILAANKHLNLPSTFPFVTVGKDSDELFHLDTQAIVITDALARKCTTDGQLAALLCMELGRMIAERERLASPRLRQEGGGPPMDVPVGGDYRNMYGGPDQTRLMELYKYDHERRRPATAAPLPSADALARGYLQKAGYDPKELAGVAPLLHDAENNVALERQLTGRATPKVMPAP
jgi:hypothetical protein